MFFRSKKKRVLLLIASVLLLALAFLSVACGEATNGERKTPDRTPVEKNYARTPLSLDSSDQDGSGKADNWVGFRCRMRVTAPTSQFAIDDVTLTLSFEGDFSDEHAAEMVADNTIYEDVDYCDLSQVELTVDYSGICREWTLKDLTRETDYPDGTYTSQVTIPQELFITEFGWFYLRLKGEFVHKGEKKEGCRTIGVAFRKIGDTVSVDPDVDVFNDEIRYSERYGYGLVVNSRIAFPTENDYIAYRFDKETFGATNFVAHFYSFGDPGTKVSVELFFGGLDGQREGYEYVELYCFDEDNLDGGKYFIKRIDDYSSEEYSCRKYDSVGGDRFYIDYSHSETIIVPKELFSEGVGRLSFVLMGKRSDQESLRYLTGVSIAYVVRERYIDSSQKTYDLLLNQNHVQGKDFSVDPDNVSALFFEE